MVFVNLTTLGFPLIVVGLSGSTEECLQHSFQPPEKTIIYTFHYLFIAQKRIKMSKGG